MLDSTGVEDVLIDDGWYVVLTFNSEDNARKFASEWEVLTGDVFNDNVFDGCGYWCVDAFPDPSSSRRFQDEDKAVK